MSEKKGSGLRSSGLGGVIKSLTKSFKPASGRVPVVVNAKVVGGASDMQKLLHQLQHDALPLRVSAALSLTKSLETYSVSSIPEIWYLARNLCETSLASSVRRVAINLMIRCIERDADEVSSRLMYFRDILAFCKNTDSALDPEFDLFFSALKVLTDDGKEIHDLCIYNQDRNWFEFVIQAYNAMKASLDARVARQKVEDELVLSFTQYIRDCVKFNFSLTNEAFVSSTIQIACHIFSATNNTGIKKSVSELLRAIAIFAFVPADVYALTIYFLCSVAPLDEDFLRMSWETMSKLFIMSPHNTVDATMSILCAPELENSKGLDATHADLRSSPDSRHLLAALGALALIEKMLLLRSEDEGMEALNIQYQPIYQGLYHTLSWNINLLNSGILRTFEHLFATVEGKEDEGDEIFNTTRRSFSAIFPFQSWYTSSYSVFSLLSRVKLVSLQDISYWEAICCSLHERHLSTNYVIPQNRLVDLFMLHPHLLNESLIDFVLRYYRNNGLCTTADISWKENCRLLLKAFYFGQLKERKNQNIRLKVLDLMKNAHKKSMLLSYDDSMGLEYVLYILETSSWNDDYRMLSLFLHDMAQDYLRSCSIASFQSVLVSLQSILIKIKRPSTGESDHTSTSSAYTHNTLESGAFEASRKSQKRDEQPSQNFAEQVASWSAQFFAELMVTNYNKASLVSDCLASMLDTFIKQKEYKALLILIRVFIRLRSTSEGNIYLHEPTDMSGLASTFKRNMQDESYERDEQHWWHFPEDLIYLPKQYFDKPNKAIFGQTQEVFSPQIRLGGVQLDLSKWLEVVIYILKECVHWEVYSYTLAHLCSQLFNLALFWHLPSQILEIQKIVCDQLALKFPRLLVSSLPESELSRSDLQIASARTLSSLIGYHDLFDKQEEENIVKALLAGLGSWQKAAVPCIHMLTICCYETSDTLKKYLIPILTKLQTGVTSVYASSSALEFLMALTHVPSMTSNFTPDEFRQVFAICFRYIEHSLDTKRRGIEEQGEYSKDQNSTHGKEAVMEGNSSTNAIKLTPFFYQYLMVVAYSVIMSWFLKVDLAERSKMSSFIVKNMIACDGAQNVDELDNMTVAYLDAITRFTYSDIPLKILTKPTPQNRGSLCRWVLGHAIVEIDTNVSSGSSTIILRRPCGVSIFDLSLSSSMISRGMSEAPKTKLMLSNHLLLQLFKPFDQENKSKPIALLDDAYTERAINTFDRIPVVSHHKAGVIYIAPGQKGEAEILANSSGSPQYRQFLEGLGDLVRLSACDSIYVGGLDKENGSDGEFAYFWSDELTHLIYHTTTLMPCSSSDKYSAMKKRHIGNNYVNVYFDESGLPFNFNVIKSQFTFLNIVLSPHTLGNNGDAREGSFYKVITYRRSGVPGIFSTSHYKLISSNQVPHLVRNIIIMTNRFSEIWHNSVNGAYTTNWQLRVKHIKALKEKTIGSQRQLEEEQSLIAQKNASTNTTESFLEQLQPLRAVGIEQARGVNEHSATISDDLFSTFGFSSNT